MPYGDSSLAVETSWPQAPQRRGYGVLPLAFATLLSFAAGVGSTLLYLQTVSDSVPMAALPLIEADKAPTRVRPEGFDAAGPRMVQFGAPGLPSPISSAMAAVVEPLVELTPQGIPHLPELAPPVAAAVIELAPPDSVSAADPTIAMSPPTPAKLEPATSQEPQFRLQLASMRTPDGAQEELMRLKRLHANLLGAFELTVQRLDQGARGVFYRVLSGSVGDRPDAASLCTAIAEKRGQCAVIALRPNPASREAQIADADGGPKGVVTKALPLATAAVAKPAAAPVPVVTSPARVVAGKVNEPSMPSNGSEVRAQLGSLRSMDGATREVARLSRLYGAELGPTELTVSRIDQGERGVFYRILTAPLPSRDAASDLCSRLAASQAGCVLVPGRPTA